MKTLVSVRAFRAHFQFKAPLTTCVCLAELYTRQIESERQCSASAPGLDSAPNAIERHTSSRFTTCAQPLPDPLCVGLPSTRDDARLITHADAAAMAAQVPNMNYPAPGSGGLPLPRTVVEAMSMMVGHLL